ncbi:hypothetical protein SAMN04487949_1780 [Halogranum gelatinilyticum]|uniref:Uncharacterized protein n=1 Tax=Halogranum gelatinilyticum TaxID=660521 RepID=A0A1G9TIK0_9EURY|nr:hypothetical protein [Halogranum gelatinilyticum]SDM47294.1 hypothetical protein SAMN04487949_1780 [Halogranum gelatinilyticum]
MATDNSSVRHVDGPAGSVVRAWAALDRGWQATVLGIGVVGGTVLLQTL